MTPVAATHLLMNNKKGEHGIGIGKKEALLQEVGPNTLEVMKSIKLALDPYWLMNPGKIMDVPTAPVRP